MLMIFVSGFDFFSLLKVLTVGVHLVSDTAIHIGGPSPGASESGVGEPDRKDGEHAPTAHDEESCGGVRRAVPTVENREHARDGREHPAPRGGLGAEVRGSDQQERHQDRGRGRRMPGRE